MNKELFQIKEQDKRYRIICVEKDAKMVEENIKKQGYKIIYKYIKETDGLVMKVKWVNFIIDSPKTIKSKDVDYMQKLCHNQLAAFETYFKEFD
jgi:hypothetical protein